MSVNDLIKSSENSDLVIEILKGYMQNKKNCIITGQSGSGKTTLLRNLIGEISERINVKYCEYLSELNLEKLYPERNIIKVDMSTFIGDRPHISKCDSFIKYDNCIFLVGELASDALVYYLLEDSYTQYNIINLATHHAPTTSLLIESLVNSYINYWETDIKKNYLDTVVVSYDEVLNLVTNFLNADIHLKVYPDGVRRIERITEIRPVNNADSRLKDVISNTIQISEEYKNRSGKTKDYYTVDVVRYDEKNNKYIII